MTAEKYFVHSSAVVDEGCDIGEGARIWHFCHLMKGCRIGDKCILGQNVFVAPNVVLGKNVKVQNNVSLYEGVVCENDVFVGPSVVFTNVINPRSFIERKTEFRKTIVRRGATIGANATILCGIEIGEFAMIGAGAVVTRDVPAHALVTGNPGRVSGWVDESGMRLEVNGQGIATDAEHRTYRLENGVLKRQP